MAAASSDRRGSKHGGATTESRKRRPLPESGTLWVGPESLEEYRQRLHDCANLIGPPSIAFPDHVSKDDRGFLRCIAARLGLCHMKVDRDDKSHLYVWRLNNRRQTTAPPAKRMRSSASVADELSPGTSTVAQQSLKDRCQTTAPPAKRMPSSASVADEQSPATSAVAQQSGASLHHRVADDSCMHEHEGFVVKAFGFEDKRYLLVECRNASTNLARKSARLLPRHVRVVFGDVWHNFPKVEHLTRARICREKGENDLCVFGEGSNIQKRKRACWIGLTILCFNIGYCCDEEKQKFASLLPLRQAAFRVAWKATVEMVTELKVTEADDDCEETAELADRSGSTHRMQVKYQR